MHFRTLHSAPPVSISRLKLVFKPHLFFFSTFNFLFFFNFFMYIDKQISKQPTTYHDAWLAQGLTAARCQSRTTTHPNPEPKRRNPKQTVEPAATPTCLALSAPKTNSTKERPDRFQFFSFLRTAHTASLLCNSNKTIHSCNDAIGSRELSQLATLQL